MDSIYKLMNKINDQDSLTEKYNVKDEKDLVTLHESLRKPLNEGINLYTTHGTLVLEQSKASRIPLNSYVSLVNLNRDAMDVLKIKIDSKVKPSQLLGIVVGAYKPTPEYVRDYALLLGLLTGKKFSDSAASSDTIYKIRVPEPFKATQNKDREMLLPRWLVSEIDEQAYIDAMNRLFPRKGLDKVIHGKDKKFNAVDGGGRAYFDKKLKNKKNEAFDDVRTLKDAKNLHESRNTKIITGEELRVAISEELPFALKELGDSRNIDAVVELMTEWLDEALFKYDEEEVREIVTEFLKDVKKLQESSNKYTSKRVVKKKKITESLSTEAEWEELDSAETMDDERSWQPLRLWKNKTENKYVIIIGDNYPWEGYVNMEFDNEAEAEHEFAAYLNEPYYNTDYEDDYDDIDEKLTEAAKTEKVERPKGYRGSVGGYYSVDRYGYHFSKQPKGEGVMISEANVDWIRNTFELKECPELEYQTLWGRGVVYKLERVKEKKDALKESVEDSFDIDKYYTRGTDKDAVAYLDDPDLAEYLYKCEIVDSSFKHVCWLMAKPEYKDALEQYDLVELVEDATGEFPAIFVDDRVYDVTDEIISYLS